VNYITLTAVKPLKLFTFIVTCFHSPSINFQSRIFERRHQCCEVHQYIQC